MGTPQRKHPGPRMNRYSFFFSSVLFFFGELVVLKCFGPRLGGNLMDVQQLHGAENSIKICSLCFDTKFGLWAQHTACNGGVTAAGCRDMRGSLLGHGGERWRPSVCLLHHWRAFCLQETLEEIYHPVDPLLDAERVFFLLSSISCTSTLKIWLMDQIISANTKLTHRHDARGGRQQNAHSSQILIQIQTYFWMTAEKKKIQTRLPYFFQPDMLFAVGGSWSSEG